LFIITTIRISIFIIIIWWVILEA